MREPVDKRKLSVEYVQLANPARLAHGLIAFAAEAERAQAALEAHRSSKEERIAKIPKPGAGDEAGLYLIWGHVPKPSLTTKDVRASYDAGAGRIRVTLPRWSGEKPEDGIGMDWSRADRTGWTFVGYRVRLSSLPAGDYSFDGAEVGGDMSRTLAEGGSL